MKTSLGVSCGAALGILLAALPTLLPAQQLVYEREYALIADAANTLSITLEPDGSTVINRPVMMTRSGVLRGKVPAHRYDELRAALDAVQVSTSDLDSDLRQRTRVELFHISDVETSRFIHLNASREVAASIEVDSLEPLARHFDDDMRLRALHELERQWWQLMHEVMAQTGGKQ